MQNKELIKISNILINQPLLISARQFDIVMFIGLLLQKRQINFNDEKFIELSVTKKEVREQLSLNENVNTIYFDKLFSDLREKNINYFKEDYNLNVSLISVYERKREEIVIFIYKEMARLFLELKNKYTIADFNIITNLTSIYSKKIYLLCMQYRNLDNKREFTIDNLKMILGADNKYKEFQNFKVRVLETVKKEMDKIIPQLKFNYSFIRKGREYDRILFTFDFSFVKQEQAEQPPQEQTEQPKEQEEEKSAYEKLTYAEPPKRRQVKIKPPTLDEIYEFMEQQCAMIDAEQFFYYYEDMGWLNEYGNPLSWRTKILDWRKRVKKGTQEYKDNVARFKNWQKEYWNREKYTEMTEKLKPFNIKNERFIKAIVNSKMEHLFNFEKGCFKNLDYDELKQEERQFINYWSEYKEKDNTELREEDLPF